VPVPVVAAAVCPHPPILIPELAAGAATELASLRESCDAAVAGLCRAAPAALVVVGSAPRAAVFRPPWQADFRPWGVDVSCQYGPAAAAPGESWSAGEPGEGWSGAASSEGWSGGAAELPLSLAVGVWLLARSGYRPPDDATGWAAYAVGADQTPERCAKLGAALAGGERVALLVLGDGSACHGEKSPGYADARAEPFDDAVAAALATVDPDRLLAMDAPLSTELRCAGRPAWQVLAGAVAAGAGSERERPWRGELLYRAAPYGVGYFVATWTRG
jgi:hypothetical protein